MPELILATNLSAGYKSKTVWRDANFVINSHEFVGLLGANGAGKTTLFRLLLGLAQPLSGEITIMGNPPSRGNANIGYIPQRRVIESETKIHAIEYVRLGLNGTKLGFSWPKQARHERDKALQALKMVDALDLAHRPINELSGGEAQRVFLAQALIGEPKLLLLDEPLANLDIRREVELIRLISNLIKKQDISVVLIAHDINPLLPVVDKIIYIANGQIATGSPDEVINSHRLSALYSSPIEVLHDSKGRVAVLGVEEAIHHGD